jgi:hypothetical protein
MARPLRIEFAGALYHMTARGNAREVIYIRLLKWVNIWCKLCYCKPGSETSRKKDERVKCKTLQL